MRRSRLSGSSSSSADRQVPAARVAEHGAQQPLPGVTHPEQQHRCRRPDVRPHGEVAAVPVREPGAEHEQQGERAADQRGARRNRPLGGRQQPEQQDAGGGDGGAGDALDLLKAAQRVSSGVEPAHAATATCTTAASSPIAAARASWPGGSSNSNRVQTAATNPPTQAVVSVARNRDGAPAGPGSPRLPVRVLVCSRCPAASVGSLSRRRPLPPARQKEPQGSLSLLHARVHTWAFSDKMKRISCLSGDPQRAGTPLTVT